MLQEDGQYCQWDTRSLADTIIVILLTLTVFMLFSRVSLRMIKYQIIDHYNKKRLIYLNLLIIIWAIVYIARKAYSILIYFTQLRGNNNSDDMKSYSMQYAKCKTLPGFLINSIFLQVFYLYYNGLMNWVEISLFTSFQHKLIKLYKIYYVVRLVKLPLDLALFFIGDSQLFLEFDEANELFIIIDGVITEIFLIVSYRMFSKYFDIIKFSKQQDKKSLKQQYFIILLFNSYRVFMVVIYLKEVQQWIFGYKESNCFQEDTLNHLLATVIHLIIGNLLTHILPIVWIMKVYDLKKSSILKVQKKIDKDNNLNDSRESLVESTARSLGRD